MPTINQILRHGRKNKKRKPKAPVLLVRTNTLKKMSNNSACQVTVISS